MSRRTHAEMSAATRQALLVEARAAFAAHGYAGAPIDEVVRAAGVTKGALYHHFGSKEGLFEAVVRDLYEGLDARAPSDLAASDDPWRDLLRASRSFLEALVDPGVRRILLVDSPAVLGPARERSLEEELTVKPMAEAFRGLAARGGLAGVDPEGLARLVDGALVAIAMWMGDGRPRDALERGLATLERMLAGIDPLPPPRRRRQVSRAVAVSRR